MKFVLNLKVKPLIKKSDQQIHCLEKKFQAIWREFHKIITTFI